MAALRRLWLLAALGLSAPLDAAGVEKWRAHIVEAAKRFDLPVPWIERVMAAESGGRTRLAGRPIRSSAGAIGLMQLMPATWEEMRRQHHLGTDPDDPRDNILAGAAYLKAMRDAFGYPGLFAAYNAGPARYRAHLAGRRALPAETRAYLSAVVPDTAAVVSPRRGSLFAIARDSSEGGSPFASNGAARGLFVPLSGGPEPAP